MKIIVVGAGISGLACANFLKEKNINCNILEGRKIGGLIRCESINGFLYHRVGGHVFNSKNKDVLAWFWGNFDRDKEFIKVERNAKIYIRRIQVRGATKMNPVMGG